MIHIDGEDRRIEQDSLFLHRLSRPTGKSPWQFSILPLYGSGGISLFPLMPGLFLSRNNFTLESPILENREYRAYSCSFLKFDFCLSGGYEFTTLSDQAVAIEKGEYGCYGGIDSFSRVEFDKGRCNTVSLFCYLDRFVSHLEPLFSEAPEKIRRFYSLITDSPQNAVQPQDNRSKQLVRELLASLEQNDPVIARLRALELLFHQMDTAVVPGGGKERYFSRTQLNQVARAKEFIERHFHQEFSIDDLSVMAGINSSYLKTIFRHQYGKSIHSYKRELRLGKAEKLLLQTNLKVYEIVQEVGYSDTGKFIRTFKDTFGLSPGAYRRERLIS